MDYFENFDWIAIRTPIKIQELEDLLTESGYPEEKIKFLVKGFKDGFSLGYEGSEHRTDQSPNLLLNDLGTKTDLWNKVMKEVKNQRYVGPYAFENLPVKDSFIQSPIGLVPKAGNQTRLIFHLSYDFNNGNTLVNANTPKEKCHIRYKDLDHAVNACIKLMKKHGKSCTIFFSKSDVKSAFRLVPMLISHSRWLVMKAEDPNMGTDMFFIDMCLPYGASISCAIFQEFSDALHHIVEYLLQVADLVTNYLDDFLFVAVMKQECDNMMTTFIMLCRQINCPLSEKKTE